MNAAKNLPFSGLEEVYERVAQAIDALPEDQERLFLAKLALALAHRVPDLSEALAAIEEAKADLA